MIQVLAKLFIIDQAAPIGSIHATIIIFQIISIIENLITNYWMLKMNFMKMIINLINSIT